MRNSIHNRKNHWPLPRLFLSSTTLSAVFLVFGLSSCNQKTLPREPVNLQIYWPAPPDQPRYRYIMSIYNSDDIHLKNNSRRFQELLTGKRKAVYDLNRPLDIAVKEGKIYLIDSTKPVIHVFDLPHRRYFNFGYRFEGKLTQPVSLAVDRKGLVYVSDRGRNSIIVYDPLGLYQRHFTLDGLTTQVAGISTDSEGKKIYIVDRGGIDSLQHQVVVINNQGELIRRFGKRGKDTGEFNLPSDIILDQKQNIYVLDTGNFRVQVFDRMGRFIKSWGKAGTGLGQFGRPRSISIDQDNHLYISDAQFGNIQIFDNDGLLLLPIGQLSSQAGPGQYSLITGLTVDQNNYLYVLDQYLQKIDIFKKINYFLNY